MSEKTKRCPQCGNDKPLNLFSKSKNGKFGLHTYCKQCDNARRNGDVLRLKQEMVAAYGGKCECCGEYRLELLTLDHLRDNGAEERRQMATERGHTSVSAKLGRNNGGKFLYAHLRRLGWPKDGYGLKCWNCNAARYYYGICPHERERQQLTDDTKPQHDLAA